MIEFHSVRSSVCALYCMPRFPAFNDALPHTKNIYLRDRKEQKQRVHEVETTNFLTSLCFKSDNHGVNRSQ